MATSITKRTNVLLQLYLGEAVERTYKRSLHQSALASPTGSNQPTCNLKEKKRDKLYIK